MLPRPADRRKPTGPGGAILFSAVPRVSTRGGGRGQAGSSSLLGAVRRPVSRRLFLALPSEGVAQQHRKPVLLFLFLGLFLLR